MGKRRTLIFAAASAAFGLAMGLTDPTNRAAWALLLGFSA